MSDDSFVVQRLSGHDSIEVFRRIANLHAELIRGGVLPLLGESFLTNLYREIAHSKRGSVHQAVLHGQVVGFVAGASDIWRCALGLTFSGYLRLASLLALRIWRPEIMWRFFDSLAYPFRRPAAPQPSLPAQDKHRAELLAIAVTGDAQGRGVGSALVSAFEETLRGRTAFYFVTTNSADTRSNAFYGAVGFEKAGQKRHHDLLIQIYTKQLIDGKQTP
jgi:ribosomal protein S18 acetylase RimI-like enzyme